MLSLSLLIVSSRTLTRSIQCALCISASTITTISSLISWPVSWLLQLFLLVAWVCLLPVLTLALWCVGCYCVCIVRYVFSKQLCCFDGQCDCGFVWWIIWPTIWPENQTTGQTIKLPKDSLSSLQSRKMLEKAYITEGSRVVSYLNTSSARWCLTSLPHCMNVDNNKGVTY